MPEALTARLALPEFVRALRRPLSREVPIYKEDVYHLAGLLLYVKLCDSTSP